MGIDDPSLRKVKLIAFQVKTMSEEDFPFAVKITNQIGWGLSEQDFEFMKELEPEGCFVLLEDSRNIGLATTVSFGSIAWFGNLVVDENRRNRGAGSTLVTHALRYLKKKNVKTVGLYAYMERIPFYRRLGFKSNSEFIVLKGESCLSKTKANVRQAETKDLKEIIDFDRSCFGASRKRMLEPIISDPDNLCCLASEKNEVVGYVAAKVYNGKAEIGPLICRKGKRTLVTDLLKGILNKLDGKETSIFVPKQEELVMSILTRSGFKENFRVQRMFHGPPTMKECIYLAESLERG